MISIPASRKPPVARAAVRLATLLPLALPSLAAALTFPLPPEDVSVVGEIRRVAAHGDETLLDIGRRHGLGYEEMRLANPDVDIWLPGEGTEVVIPTRFILPDAPREGIVLNVAEMRLYYYPEEGGRVETYAVSIGRQDWSTPVGTTRIIDKVKDPSWIPPESIRQEAAADGRELPAVIGPGPDNPLGRFKMRLGIPGYLIHSTNRPWGVGMRVTHGCVRMYPEDIESLFGRIPVGTAVHIVNQPVKAGWHAGVLYLESHPPLEEELGLTHPLASAVEALTALLSTADRRVDYERLRSVATSRTGIPRPVSRLQPAEGGVGVTFDVTDRRI